MQDPNTLLAILRTMAQKPGVQFDKLFQKLYNIDLWLLAYQSIAPKPGNMTAGVDGKTIDGAGLKLITDLIADLKASRYTPHPVRRTYIPKANGKLRPLGILIDDNNISRHRLLKVPKRQGESKTCVTAQFKHWSI